jgi:hypothetical protein
MLFWQVPAPDEALLISGSKHKDGRRSSGSSRGTAPS